MGDTIYAPNSTHAQLASDTADNLLWSRYAQTSSSTILPVHVTAALSRIAFREVSSGISTGSGALQTALGALPTEKDANVIVVAGRARDVSRKTHAAELKTLLSSSSSTSSTSPSSPSSGNRDVSASITGDKDGEALARTVGYVGAMFLTAPTAVAKTGGVLVLQKVAQAGAGA